MKSGSWSAFQAAAELPDRDDDECIHGCPAGVECGFCEAERLKDHCVDLENYIAELLELLGKCHIALRQLDPNRPIIKELDATFEEVK